MLLEKNIDSISDHIINFTTNNRLTKPYLPQMGLKVSQKLCDYWQPQYLRKNVTNTFKEVLKNIDASATQHYERK